MVDLEASTDPHKRGKVTIKFGELIVSSDFDSGTKRGGGVTVHTSLEAYPKGPGNEATKPVSY